MLTTTVEIAHIRSEKSTGPRYEASYPKSKINSFENLLLLCERHHKPVDRHSSTYSTTELLTWKSRQSRQGDLAVTTADLAAIERSVNQRQPVPSDAILRGPIVHLGQAERLQQAEDRLPEAPLEAADLLDQVACALEDSPFMHHASFIRSRQAAALEAAEEFERAGQLRMDLGWQSVRVGDAFGAKRNVTEFAKYETRVGQPIRRSVVALSYVAAFGYERGVSLHDVARAFDDMEDGDGYLTDCALNVAEQAVVWRDLDVIRSRLPRFRTIASRLPNIGDEASRRARLAMCLAEAAGDWDTLVGEIHSYPLPIAAWISARHARYLTITGKPDLAIASWMGSIDSATRSELNDSAAVWIYAVRAARLQYLRIDEGIDDLHRLAQALRGAGSGSVFPQSSRLAEKSLSAMLAEKWPDAFHSLHQHLSHSVVSANYGDEMITNERFGDLYAATGKWLEAAEHYVRGGRSKKLKELAKKLPDVILDFRPPPSDAPHWERQASFNFAAAAGDYFSTELASEWGETACRELEQAHQAHPWSDTWIPAFEAFSSVSDAVARDVADAFLRLTVDRLQREPGTHYFADKEHIKSLVQIAESHEDLHDRVFEELCNAILVGDEVGKAAIHEGIQLLTRDPDLVHARVSGAASNGNLQAVLALIAVKADTSCVVDIAQQWFDRHIDPPQIIPGVVSTGTGLRQAASLVTVLDSEKQARFVRAMIVRLRETRDVVANRVDALVAISIVGPSLPSVERATVFHEIISFAQAPTESQVSFGFGNDPFSRFKVLPLDLSLAVVSVQVAGKLADSPEQFRQVRDIAVGLLASAYDSELFRLSSTLRDIPPEHFDLDINLFAAHPNRWVRALAAIVWTRKPDQSHTLGARLATDAEASVRYALAAYLGTSDDFQEVRSILQNDSRRVVRKALQTQPAPSVRQSRPPT